jgi:hypothetical protein
MSASRDTFLGIPVSIPSDSSRRAADAVNLHIYAHGDQAFGKWVAIRLSDGGSDGVLYDSRRDAIRHQFHERQCCYFRIPPFGQTITPAEAETFLSYNRSIYDAGYRMPDPDAPAPIPQLTPVVAPRRGAKLALPHRGEWT